LLLINGRKHLKKLVEIAAKRAADSDNASKDIIDLDQDQKNPRQPQIIPPLPTLEKAWLAPAPKLASGLIPLRDIRNAGTGLTLSPSAKELQAMLDANNDEDEDEDDDDYEPSPDRMTQSIDQFAETR
jgi:hypothetical protein